MSTDPPQQPCIHCGECVRVCPEAIDPEQLFFALVADALPTASALHLDACTECDLCVAACPSHIPLTDWFRWGKSTLQERARADAAKARHLARTARLERESSTRATRRAAGPVAAPASPAREISRAQVLAAIARGRAKRKSTP